MESRGVFQSKASLQKKFCDDYAIITLLTMRNGWKCCERWEYKRRNYLNEEGCPNLRLVNIPLTLSEDAKGMINNSTPSLK